MFCVISELSGNMSSAAALGVATEKLAAKSRIVESVSCPTALTTGFSHFITARASSSELKGSRSSFEPPPRPTIMTSTSSSLESLSNAAIMLAGASLQRGERVHHLKLLFEFRKFGVFSIQKLF